MSQVKNVCFTLNNPVFAASALAFPEEHVSYAVWQLERGEDTGTLHIQGYVELKQRARFPQISQRIPMLKGAHFEKRRGSAQEASDYCEKEDTRVDGPWHFGTISKGAGARTDLESVKDYILAGGDKRKVYEEFPEVAAKYPRYVEQMIKYRVEDQTEKLLELEPKYKWQQCVLDYVDAAPSTRDILWVYCPHGNTGKTYLSKHLVDKYGAFYCNGGKAADITFAYNGESTIIFDYVRDAKEYVNYGVIEQVKNGILFSSKYESGMKRFTVPRVIVMANFQPDKDKFSKDRYNVLDISNPDDPTPVRYEDLTVGVQTAFMLRTKP